MLKKVLITTAITVLFVACEREAEVTDTALTPAPDAAVSTFGTDTAVTQTQVAADPWGGYTDWDVDRNNQLAREEFDTRFGNVYTGWSGTDNTLTADEARDTWRDWFDGNNDNIIDSNEWTRATSNWNVRDYNWGDMGTWDTDRNNQITDAEWNAGFNRAAPANATWTRDEMADTWWDFFDGNDDNIVDAQEWDTRSAYWRDNV